MSVTPGRLPRRLATPPPASALSGRGRRCHLSITRPVLLWVPSHVVLLRNLNGCHRQRRRHLHARLLVSDPEYLLHRLLALRLDKLPRFPFAIAAPTHANEKARCENVLVCFAFLVSGCFQFAGLSLESVSRFHLKSLRVPLMSDVGCVPASPTPGYK